MLMLRDPPLPKAPSRSDDQTIVAVRSPSSASLAVALRPSGVPSLMVVPALGAEIVTTGAALSTTVSVVWALPELPTLSAAEAVSVWVPTESVFRASVPPAPSEPSRLEAQAIEAVRSPSSGSLAVVARLTRVPSVAVEPLTGDVIVTVGGVVSPATEKLMLKSSGFALGMVAVSWQRTWKL